MHNDLGYDGIDRHFTSYSGKTFSSLVLGDAVTNTGSKEIGWGSTTNSLTGKIVHKDEDNLVVTVQDQGYIEVDYAGTAPAINDRVVVDGAGNVITSAVGYTGGRPKIIDIATFATDGKVVVLL